jgi:hypothetical protein
MSRPYYQCLHVGEAEEKQDCTHGEAPADMLWGVDEQRTTPGVQEHISYLSARLTFEEAAETLRRSVPIGMSGRQALNLMRPVGEALAASEAQQVMALEAEARQARSLPKERQQQTAIERLYIELDGVLARMRRGSVPMEQEEVQRKGDVYREIKAGAVFRAERGPKRSELAPGVYVDTPAEDSVRYVARRTAKGGFGWLLYHLAVECGLEQAKPGGRAGRRRAMDLESGRRTLCRGRADRGSLSCQRTCVGRSPCCLWTRHSSGNGLGHARLLAARTGTA